MKNKWGRRIGVFALAAISSICTIDMNSLAVSAANRTWQFNYVENVQEWTVPYSGDYKIESYGGKGADYADKRGGKGGKVTSTYTFQQGDVLKIYTGGNGNNPSGGWGNVAGAHTGNGGNDGGGATEIYVTRDGSTTRLMVAGGGGGANRDFDGGAGGAVVPEVVTVEEAVAAITPVVTAIWYKPIYHIWCLHHQRMLMALMYIPVGQAILNSQVP